MKKHLSTLLLAGAMAMTSLAHGAASLSVTAPWVRATVPAQKSTGAFMHVQSAVPARLVGVSSPIAATVELHQMKMSGTTMKMARVEGIDLPAGKGVNLASGGYHIMLMGLTRQLQEGEAIDLTLRVQSKGKKIENITVKVPVKPMTFVSPGQAGHMGH
ncbi:copper chaperone PCu(A)C [Massilia sp. PAMC28688]|uniref:copper chaperone PCu(A)C n=1 Tax=Massilia sp. PAMC28688 TaxID=2861283 RepID=UPI001C6355B8|nr:copper chaperone PCu(A)C [Massilia sp. PAMC28688]QYF93759.1 copper chaperone PCu(A)C [Massilia sp. PAMC28688]